MTEQGPLDPDEMPRWLASLWPTAELPEDIIAGVNADDCAVLRMTDHLLVLSTDYLNAWPIALELDIGTMTDLGRLVVAANLADLCGSGATPRALLVAVTMKRGTPERHFKEIMRGVRVEADRWDVSVVGGDTKLGDSTAILGVAVGTAESESQLFLKSGARPGDMVWVSGPIGSCNAAVVGFKRGDLSPEWQEWAKEAIISPQLPLLQSGRLARSQLGNGGTDISDGLGSDIHSLCAASEVGAVIDAHRIPVDEHVVEVATKLGVPVWAFAFGGGGDCQIVVTSSALTARQVEDMGFTRIGEITANQDIILRTATNEERALEPMGHRDSRAQSFADEITSLVQEVANLT